METWPPTASLLTISYGTVEEDSSSAVSKKKKKNTHVWRCLGQTSETPGLVPTGLVGLSSEKKEAQAARHPDLAFKAVYTGLDTDKSRSLHSGQAGLDESLSLKASTAKQREEGPREGPVILIDLATQALWA